MNNSILPVLLCLLCTWNDDPNVCNNNTTLALCLCLLLSCPNNPTDTNGGIIL